MKGQTQMKPAYEHDCEHCVFMGTINVKEGPVDLYVHEEGELPSHLIVRHSDEPSDNQSLPYKYAVKTDGILKVAALVYEEIKKGE